MENEKEKPLLGKLYILGEVGMRDKFTGKMFSGMCVSPNNQGLLKLPKILVLNKSPFLNLIAELERVAKEKGVIKENEVLKDLNIFEQLDEKEKESLLKAALNDFIHFKKKIVEVMGEFNARG